MKERDNYFDIVKGIAILLVVVGHTIQYGNGNVYCSNNLFYQNLAFKIIYSFHMPLFMLISGYFFYYSNKKYNVLELIENKTKTIFIPILSFSFLYFLLTMFTFSDGALLSIRKYVLTLINIKIYWFLWAVLSASITLKLLSVLRNRFIIALACVSLFLVLPLYVDDKLGLYLCFFIYPYFIIGYLANKYKVFPILKENKYKTLLISSFCHIILLCIYSENSFIYTSKLSLFQNGLFSINQLFVDLYRWTIGLIGCVMILTLIYILIPFLSKLVDVLSRLGVFSLGIYCFQVIYFQIYNKYFTNNVGGTLLFIIILFLCIFSTFVVSKINILNKYYLGSRQ